jgi:hypothetical protein
MAKSGKPFEVDTRPTKDVVVSGLTKDATVEACIFDLIDNSIDAARDSVFQLGQHDSGLLDDYSGFIIDLDFSGISFKIEDNCGGISVEDLKTTVLRFGQMSQHDTGIGVFGVGLNRALFKLGRISQFHTDTGTERAELVLNVDNYLKSDKWELPAEEFPSTEKPGTRIEIQSLSPEVSKDFADADWASDIREEIGRRYGRFLAKGLEIKVNRIPAPIHDVEIRENGPFESVTKFFKAGDGVAVYVQYGQHEGHRFTNEADYDRDANLKLTSEYGWNILCNDRAILIADQSFKTGWDTKFHSEFYGFVGVVSFISSDPAKLPWNTTKTDVDLNNPAYQLALADMRAFAKKWREWAEQRKKKGRKGEKLSSIPPAPKAPPQLPPMRPEGASKPPEITGQKLRPPTTIKDGDPELRFILPADLDEAHCNDKLLSLVREGKSIDLGTLVYSGLALLRMLFETASVQFLIRHGHSDEIKTFAIAKRRSKGMSVPPDQEKNLVPSMDEMLIFLEERRDLLGSIKGAHLRHSLKNMQGHQKTLNGVMHVPYQQVSRLTAFQIRDEILPILRHLIET